MIFSPRLAAALAVALVSFACSEAPPAGPLLEAQIASGSIAGVQQGDVAAYLGVPFAEPPVGDLRWTDPTPVAPWEGVLQADHFGASCIQKLYPNGITTGPWTKEYVVPADSEFSEDCLYLNVWTPATSTGEKLPVFFWIYGGGFNQGSGSVPLYDGAAMASRGVIFVSVNYRVGVLGLMAHPELSAEASRNSSGNYAIQDMIAGLQWVHDNIAEFGGDPSKMTIAGQSAGSRGVHELIAAPGAKGLFAQAISQSGSRVAGNGTELDAAEANGVAFMETAGAASLAELRALSADEIMAVDLTGIQRFNPIVDGVVRPVSLAEAYDTGSYNDTPVLTGFVADEGSSSATYGQSTTTEFEAMIRRFYPDDADRFLAVYPATDDATAGEMSKSLARDRNLASAYLWAEKRMETSEYPIYEYLFTHTKPGPDSAKFGAFHSAELGYVFNTLDRSPGRNFTDVDHDIAEKMGSYWTNFVKTGNPNGDGLPEWPLLDTESKQIMELGGQFAPRDVLSAEKLALFEAANQR